MKDSEKNRIDHLTELLKSLTSSVSSLQRSYQECKSIEEKNENLIGLSWEDSNSLEALCSRFARVSDILLKDIFILIDQIEQEDIGSNIDIISKSEAYSKNLIMKLRMS